MNGPIKNGDVFIRGVGQSAYGSSLPEPVELLMARAVKAACADAGIDPKDLDGIISIPGHIDAETIISTFRIPEVRFRALLNLGGASAASSLGLAAMAIRSGEAKNVMIVRGLKGNSGPRKHERPSYASNQGLRKQLEATVGWNTPAQKYSMLARRYMDEYGLTREHLGEVALAARAHANLNPGAQMYGREMTLDDYRNSRMISDPYLLFDCCLETDGSCAVIVSADPGNDSRPAVRIVGGADGHPDSPDDLSNRRDFLHVGLEKAAKRIWSLVDYGPDDIHAAMVYDCFTFEVVHQLEAAGFGDAGQIQSLIASGGIRLGGKLPVNTSGGMLSEGHLQGLSHVVEAARQVRGDAHGRQVEGASRVVITGWGNLGDGAMALVEAPDA
jgi:acetyl-CoA acetyltransferase